jgi:small redox-active disulfide protein 2
MIIKIIGTWCPKCKLLQQTTEDAANKLGLNYTIIKVDKMEDILQYDIMTTPWLLINDKVILTGKVPSLKDMINILTTQQ